MEEKETDELSFASHEQPEIAISASSVRVTDIAGVTHKGHVRQINEDHYLVIRFGRSLENLMSNLPEGMLKGNYDITGYGMFVADGMGGMAAGDVASRMAVTKLIELIVDTPDWILSIDKEEALETVTQRMTERFLRVDKTIKEEARQDTTRRGMGTTLTVAGVLGRNLLIGHVGDSRAYLLRDEKIAQLTKDHTVAQALIDAGVSPNDPVSSSLQHLLTAALGALDAEIEPEVNRWHLSPGDQLILCSDGLTKMVDDATILKAACEANSAARACHDLIELALAGGGLDNITVVLARFGD
jgi:PPM family protein phosphatase